LLVATGWRRLSGAQPELPYYAHAASYVKGNLGLFEVCAGGCGFCRTWPEFSEGEALRERRYLIDLGRVR